MNRRRFLALSALLASAAALQGCGFHLRGQGGEEDRLTIKTLRLKGVSVFSGFGRRLADTIESNGIMLVDEDFPADKVLQITTPKRRRDVLSVDSSVHAREYSLVTTSRFRILDGPAKDDQGASWQRLEVRRDLVIDPNDILGSDYEAERLNNEMDQELVDLLIFRLRAVSNDGSDNQ